MNTSNRREFIGDVSRAMLIAGLGAPLAHELGVSSAFANQGPSRLDFGDLRPLVCLLQETELSKLQPLLVEKLKSGGATLHQLIAAASLANAETFGGDDYVGFHTEMALLPAYNMSQLLPEPQQPLPVLKVLYRNSERIQEFGAEKKTLAIIEPLTTDGAATPPVELLNATRAGDLTRAERLFANAARGPLDEAFNQLQYIVQDDMNVHRFVLAHRALGLAAFVGTEHAHTLLRQSVRFCVNSCESAKRFGTPIRDQMVKAMDKHRLVGRRFGSGTRDDAWVEKLAMTVYSAGKEGAVDAVAAAIAERTAPDTIAEAISLAANQLVLRQDGGRTHGDSRGVHGSDAVNAWRNMIRVVDQPNAMIGLLVAAYHTADYSIDTLKGEPYPHETHRLKVQSESAEGLLRETEGAIRENDQARAAAAIDLYGRKGYAPKPVFDLMLQFAVTEDGRLHGEKYYQTVSEEFATTRPAFRWRQLVALSRVTASAYSFNRDDKSGFRAPGYEEARRLLGV